ncbi:LysM repeat protein [Desulfitispora alkaliphila]|uniref:BsuPI-related putative proteinase inhibitor n=1 Tax=Desulfitispora alkaliphila TaxID=622674 RepID=UPI003D1EB2B6
MFFTHEVQAGENLETLAERFDVTVDEILAVNELPNPGRLPTRIVIRIPIAFLPPTVPSPRPMQNITTRIVGNLLYVFITDRMLYRRQQPVRLTLIKTNISNRPVVLTYRTTQRFNFLVRRSRTGRPIWDWAFDRAFGPAIERRVLEPGQSQVFRATWDQRTNEGNLVTPGVFFVSGVNVAEELRGREITLRIRITG